MQTLACLTPDTGNIKLMPVTYHNPVDIAERTVTLDHLSGGKFVLGVDLGYWEKELWPSAPTGEIERRF